MIRRRVHKRPLHSVPVAGSPPARGSRGRLVRAGIDWYQLVRARIERYQLVSARIER
ncbi:hypothetical protein GA0115241_106512 [Streptomyces sp. DpondAA-D4]|nr:hypothetical protein YUMDRAFT_06151 [Streptomyces sp. OspMP-M45]SCD78419.1 hypothetical protein GA0115241_106512 [Streptomyces sp. DpondAA-D4]SCE35395.1 hypothetical protein GA0115249_118812 [Streptomyces sp. PpalLS-921]